MIYKTVKTNGLSLQLKSLPPKPQPPSPKPPSPPTFLKSMQSSVSLPSAKTTSLHLDSNTSALFYITTNNQHNISQVSYISSDSGHPDFKCLREMKPCNLKYVTLPWCVLEHLTCSPKYVTPPPRGHWLFWSKKCPSGFDIAIKATKTPSRPR